LASIEEKEKCAATEEIRNTIINFVFTKDKAIYEKEFLALLSKNKEKQNGCYFPENEMDVKLYLALGDTSLINDFTTDERAMGLLIDLYLLNQNNMELTEYYGLKVIPKAALKDTKAFVKALSSKTEREAGLCISALKNVQEKPDKDKIKAAIGKLGKSEYSSVLDKMNKTLGD
jgi:hypothetical protein